MLAGGGVGPLAGDARRREADEERAPLGAVEVARDPIAALPAAVRKIAPADFLGACAEMDGDIGWPRSWRSPGEHAGRDGLWGMTMLLLPPARMPGSGRPPLPVGAGRRSGSHAVWARGPIGCGLEAGLQRKWADARSAGPSRGRALPPAFRAFAWMAGCRRSTRRQRPHDDDRHGGHGGGGPGRAGCVTVPAAQSGALPPGSALPARGRSVANMVQVSRVSPAAG